MNTEEIIEGYLGSTIVNSIYQGSELVWPEKYFGNRYMIGGNFTAPKNKIIRINDDDSIDHTWYNNNSYTSGSIYDLKYDNINRKVYAAGDPALEGGLVRFNLDGTKDSTFNIGTGFNALVRSIIIDNTNSKIYVGGEFTTYNGTTQNRLVRLNMDGSLDSSFNIGSGFNSTVWDVILVNNKLYVGGAFTTYKDITENRLVVLYMNGSLSYFNIGTGFDNTVRSIIIDNTNSKIYVGGDFTTYNDSTQNRIVRLNMNGSLDTSFKTFSGFSNAIYTINMDTINQKIYVGGYFTGYQGWAHYKIVRLNMDGSRDTSFKTGGGFEGMLELPYDILIDNEKNKIYIVGKFNKYNDQPQKHITRLNMDGSLDMNFNIQLDAPAQTILKFKI